jgi:hypothetical protein
MLNAANFALNLVDAERSDTDVCFNSSLAL